MSETPARANDAAESNRLFHAEAADRSARAVVIVTFAACTFYLLWALGDYEYFPDVAFRFTLIRIAVVAWCVATALAAIGSKRVGAKYAAIWLWCMAWAADSAFMIRYTPDHLLAHVVVIIIAQIGSASVVVWPWRWGLTMSLALAGIGEIGLAQAASHGYDVFAAHAYLVTGAVLGPVFTELKYRSARDQFRQRRELASQKAQTESLLTEVRHMKEDRFHWLENLARFLRHEIKNQVVAVSTSLDLLEDETPVRPRHRYIGRARRSLGRMDRLVTHATEATSLEAALVDEDASLVDLSEIVGERVLLFRESPNGRTICADIEPEIRLIGSQDRLAQLLDKLLENAVEHTAGGGRIGVSLTRDDSGVTLCVENDGEPLPEAPERLFRAFVSEGKSQRSSENIGLGLFVAKSIARAHDAEIVAMDLPNGPGVRFEIRF